MYQMMFHSENGDWSCLGEKSGRENGSDAGEESVASAAAAGGSEGSGGASYPNDVEAPVSGQRALDALDEASMESFPCSDPPSSSRAHA